MNIKILALDCPNCRRFEEHVHTAIQNLNIEPEIERLTDAEDMINLGIASSPALIVDDEIKSSGKVLSVEQIERFLQSQ
ncbi:MAG: thioredoxin family protein [Alkalispirochaeta sp.]